MKFKAVAVFLCLLLSGGSVLDGIETRLWMTWAMILVFAMVAVLLYRKGRLPHWSWIGVWFVAGLALVAASGHPMHTGLSVVEHKLCCYGAAFSGPLGVWLLPCCERYRGLATVAFSFVPILFVLAASALYWWKRDRPFRILLAVALSFWLWCGMSTLVLYK